jgi:hypothetical protein
MTKIKSHLTRGRRVVLMAALVTAAAALVPLPGSAASAADDQACQGRVNNSAQKLIDCVRTADLWQHMQAFQRIADANPGPDGHPSRNSGEPGYKASADYVAKVMKDAGYDVKIQTYTFDYFTFVGTPAFSVVSPTPTTFVVGKDFNPAPVNAPTATAAVQTVGHTVIPPTPTPTSASGCDPADFAGFAPGHIALIQRGTCTFATKATNAEAAGASGVIIFNEGNTTPDRTGPLNGSLGDASLHIPVVFTPFAIGRDLYTQATTGTAPVVTIDVKTFEDPNRVDYNVIAESRGGDPNSVLVIDAHLDAIFGAGMLDNASGSAAILDIAQHLKNTRTPNKLRFIWFGGEELGLLGSNHYINSLSPTELSKIKFDLDADVLATPNYVAGVLDPEGVNLFGRGPGTPMPPEINAPSRVARDAGIAYLNSIGKNNILFSADGTDAFVFEQVGIPASGVLTGQDCCKLASDVDLFGGQTGNFEGNLGTTDGGCVDNPFRWCDNLSNNDPAVLTFMSKTFAAMVAKMAFDTTLVMQPTGKNHGGLPRHEARGRPDS